MPLETVETLAVRYRPRVLEHLIGQEPVVNVLKGMFKTNKVNKSFLLVGGSGLGKTSCARIIANYINCENFDHENVKVCGTCSYCQAVARGDYLDVEEINFANTRGIDTVRSLTDKLIYEPMCNAKVFILDECHRMTNDAQAAFLKPVEEPPQGVIFLFLTTDPHKLLDTIRNRCTKLMFQKPPEPVLAEYLKDVAAREKRTVPDALLKQIAIASRGHIRQALAYLENIFYAIDGDPAFDPTDFDKVTALIGQNVDDNEVTIAQYLIQGIYRGKFSQALRVANILLRNTGSNPRRFFENVAHLHTQTLYAMVDPNERVKEFSSDYYANWRTTLVGETKAGGFLLTTSAAANIMQLLLELSDRLSNFEVDTVQVVNAYTVRMVQTVIATAHEAYSKASAFHRIVAPERIVG